MRCGKTNYNLIPRQRDTGRQGDFPRLDLGVARVHVLAVIFAVILLEARLVVDLHRAPRTLVRQIPEIMAAQKTSVYRTGLVSLTLV